jgi:hypothetical protein
VAGLFILKRTHNLSDEVLCARWLENPYYQFFYGELSFCHKLPFDRSSLTHWRQRLGEEQRDVRSDAPRKSGSQWTRRWREMDSNHRFLVRRSRFLLRKANCRGRGVHAVRADIDDPTLPLPPSFNLWSGSAGVRTRTDASWSAVEPRPSLSRSPKIRSRRSAGRQRRGKSTSRSGLPELDRADLKLRNLLAG